MVQSDTAPEAITNAAEPILKFQETASQTKEPVSIGSAHNGWAGRPKARHAWYSRSGNMLSYIKLCVKKDELQPVWWQSRQKRLARSGTESNFSSSETEVLASFSMPSQEAKLL